MTPSSSASISASPAMPITDSWRQWIAENKLLRASDPSMIDALMRNGKVFEVFSQYAPLRATGYAGLRTSERRD